MQKIKASLYVSLAILALSVAFHLGARTAQGQAGSEVIRTETRSGDRNYLWVVTKDGSAYMIDAPFVDGRHQIQVMAKGSIHQKPLGEQ
jgi:hypothetical protein